jgi:hypothetical protein
MNVTSPLSQPASQTSSHTLPIRRNAETPVDATATPATKTTPSNPSHLGNRIDTTA